MKQIEKIQIWQNGQIKTAELLNVYSISDNLKDSATFYYGLFTKNNELLAQSNLTMTGSDYTEYTSNESAFSWISKELNLVIIGDENLLGEDTPPTPVDDDTK